MAYSSFLTILWMFLVPLIAILFPVWLGQRYGLYVKKRSVDIQDAPISSTVGATLGLFAFMLAFTFQIVGNRYDKRKELLVNEISDIRTAYLYAGLIPEPYRADARQMIVTYVDIRVELLYDPLKLPGVKLRSEQILDSLWNYSETLGAQDRGSETYALFITSISRLMSLFNQRITITLQSRLPKAILYILGFVGFLSMLILGYQFGVSGRMNILVNLLLGTSFAAVMWLIFALDHPETGLIRLDSSPLLTLQEQLHRR